MCSKELSVDCRACFISSIFRLSVTTTFSNSFIISLYQKKLKNATKSIDKRRKGVYDILVIDIWWVMALSIGKLNIGYP